MSNAAGRDAPPGRAVVTQRGRATDWPIDAIPGQADRAVESSDLFQPENRVLEIDSDPILAQELVPDDPADLEAE